MDELNLFISESVIMKDFKHKNVLGLVGVSVGVTDDIAAPYIILPYMVNGDLKGYLQSKRSEAEDNQESLLKVFARIANWAVVTPLYIMSSLFVLLFVIL